MSYNITGYQPTYRFVPPLIYLVDDKSLARPGKQQATATKLLTFASHSKTIQKVVHPTRSPRQQWPPRRTKNGDLSIVFFSRVGL